MFKNGYAIVEEGDEEEAKSDWLLCKITDYNVQSGEHLVCRLTKMGSSRRCRVDGVGIATHKTKRGNKEELG